MQGRYEHKKTRANEIDDDSTLAVQAPYNSNLNKSIVNKPSGTQFNHHSAGSPSKADVNEQLNLAFCTKVFNPEAPFFKKLGSIWDLQAQLDELLSLIGPEVQRSKNNLLINYTD